MGISAIGNTYTYVYNTETKKLSTANGTEDDFVKYFNGDIEGSESETLNGFDAQRKGDFERILMLMGWGKLAHNQIGNDTEIKISGTIVDGDTTEYTINDEAVFTAYVAPSFTYSEYEEICDIWASGEDYACTNDNSYPYPDSVYNKVLQRYEEWLYQPLSARIKTSDIDSAATETNNAGKILEDKINELFVKIQNGDTEVTVQIGAQTFTEKEWEEFLGKFDSTEEAIQELMDEEQGRNEVEKTQKENVVNPDADTLLTAESTSCTYPTDDPDDEDIRYITWYTEEGIFCRKAGQTEGYEWSIVFENKEQYNKVMEFIGKFPSDWNLRFAANENFWKDFLNNEIDMDGFMEFMNGTNKGVPDFSVTVGDSMYFDRDKMQWSKYMNSFVGSVYSKEELLQAVDKEVQSNQHKKKSLYEMLRDSSIEGTNAKFSFVGESKIYSFYEFIEEFERRFQANLELS